MQLSKRCNFIILYRVCACISRIYNLGQEFGNNNNNNNNTYISRIRFYLCESKIFAIAFAALWLSLAAFTVICQWCHGLPPFGNRSIIDGVGYSHVIKIYRYTGNTLAHSRVCNSLQYNISNISGLYWEFHNIKYRRRGLTRQKNIIFCA
jgi:hypothetical protein